MYFVSYIQSIASIQCLFTVFVVCPSESDWSRFCRLPPLTTGVDFSLAQIVPVLDETGETEPKIVAASIAEPYILLLRDDLRCMILRADDAGDLEEIETSGTLSSGQWKAGSLFDDVNDVFRLTFDGMDEENSSSVLMFLLDKDGGLHVSAMAT